MRKLKPCVRIGFKCSQRYFSYNAFTPKNLLCHLKKILMQKRSLCHFLNSQHNYLFFNLTVKPNKKKTKKKRKKTPLTFNFKNFNWHPYPKQIHSFFVCKEMKVVSAFSNLRIEFFLFYNSLSQTLWLLGCYQFFCKIHLF